MEVYNAVHEVGSCILIVSELDTAAKDVLLCRESVEPDVGTVHNGTDKAFVHRVVNLVPECCNKGVVDVAEHTADGDECVLHVGIVGIACGTVAPCLPSALIDCGNNALTVEISASFNVQKYLRTVIDYG